MGNGEKTITTIIRSVDGPVAMRYHPSAGEVAVANHAGERAIVATMRYNARGELEIEIEDEEGEKTILWAGTIATGDEGQIAIKATRAHWSGDLWDEIAPSLGIEGDNEIETPAGKQARDLLTESVWHDNEVAAFEQATRWATRHQRAYAVYHLAASGRYTVELDPSDRRHGYAGCRLVGRVDREHPAGLKNHAPIPEEIITDAEARDLAEKLSAEVLKRPVTVGTQRAKPKRTPEEIAARREFATPAYAQTEESAREEAQRRARLAGKPYEVYVMPQGNFQIIDPDEIEDPRYESDYIMAYSTTEEEEEAAPDPLAAFRDLDIGAPLYDRAGGRLIGHLERVTGDTVQLKSVITGHSVYSSGLAIVPEDAPR